MIMITESLLEKELYHGTVSNFTIPDLLKSNEALDFGKGFYLTSIQRQAEVFADMGDRKKNKYKENAGKRVNRYLIDDETESLKVKCYNKFDEKCMYYILKCRAMNDDNKDTDIIIGPVADGRGRDLINNSKELILDLQNGDITEDELFEELNYLISKFKFTNEEGKDKYTNQIVLKTQKSIECLKFKGIITRW